MFNFRSGIRFSFPHRTSAWPNVPDGRRKTMPYTDHRRYRHYFRSSIISSISKCESSLGRILKVLDHDVYRISRLHTDRPRLFVHFRGLARSLQLSQNKTTVESGCVTLQSLVLSIRIMCKDLWKLLHDNYTSVLSEWNYESISYKLYLTRREMPRITHHVSEVSVVTCLIRNGHI
jgi:hypothetical protein